MFENPKGILNGICIVVDMFDPMLSCFNFWWVVLDPSKNAIQNQKLTGYE